MNAHPANLPLVVMGLWCALLLALLCSEARGGEKAEVSLQKDGEDRIVRGTIDIPGPPDIVWALLVDYDSLKILIPNVEKSRLLAREADGQVRVEQVWRHRFLLFQKRVRVLLRVSEQPPFRIDFSLIEGDFQTYRGTWDVVPQEGRTSLRLTLRLRPAFFAPDFILDTLSRTSAARTLEAFRRESLRRMRKDRPIQD